jgi:NRAMP (natural resistance-associated macrophage protein)-like metal ion transporter
MQQRATKKLTVEPSAERVSKGLAARAKAFLWKLGPGLITGAADDDPSGIATYSQVGAQFGYGMLWSMLFSFPLMAAIQEISARIGRVSGIGVGGNIRRHYPRPYLYGIVSLLLVANIFDIGADIGAVGATTFLGLPLNVIHLNPIKALVLAAVLNRVVAGPVIVFMMLLGINPKVMGKFTLPPASRFAGRLATMVMILVSAGMPATIRR